MREIKVRGLVIEPLVSGEKWITSDEEYHEVYLNYAERSAYINGHAVVWESVSEYTGLKDKNGKEIYEGHILECTSELLTNFGKTKTGRYETTYKQVIWLTDSWGYRVIKSKYIVEGAERKGLEVAIKFGVVCGNIYENPELLKGADKE